MTIQLKNQRVLVTRNEPKASEFAQQITQYGGHAVVTPLIKIDCQHQFIGHLEMYEWIIFTSANGVRCFFKNVEKEGKEDQLAAARFAVVGPKTNQALQVFGYQAEFIPSIYDAKTMAPEFLEKHQPTGRMLLVQGQLSRPVLKEALQMKNIPVDCMKVYDTVTNWEARAQLNQALATQSFDFITFTSPSTVDAFVELTGETGVEIQSIIVCIGTTTEKRARTHEFRKILVPDEFTIEGMMEKMHEYISENKRGEPYVK